MHQCVFFEICSLVRRCIRSVIQPTCNKIIVEEICWRTFHNLFVPLSIDLRFGIDERILRKHEDQYCTREHINSLWCVYVSGVWALVLQNVLVVSWLSNVAAELASNSQQWLGLRMLNSSIDSTCWTSKYGLFDVNNSLSTSYSMMHWTAVEYQRASGNTWALWRVALSTFGFFIFV